MSQSNTAKPSRPPRQSAFWITLARSILALALGMALILQPDKTRPMLVNFIGLFWLSAGLMSLRWSATGGPARRSSVVVAIVSILAGALVLARFVMINLIGVEIIILLMSAIFIFTGLVHIFEGVRAGPSHERQRSWTSALLGVFEFVLGIVLLVWRDDFGPLFYAIVVIWAFISSLVLMRDALRQRASRIQP